MTLESLPGIAPATPIFDLENTSIVPDENFLGEVRKQSEYTAEIERFVAEAVKGVLDEVWPVPEYADARFGHGDGEDDLDVRVMVAIVEEHVEEHVKEYIAEYGTSPPQDERDWWRNYAAYDLSQKYMEERYVEAAQ